MAPIFLGSGIKHTTMPENLELYMLTTWYLYSNRRSPCRNVGTFREVSATAPNKYSFEVSESRMQEVACKRSPIDATH
ncbi:uncharacterized protein METZ01_LOCUS243919 [marine metagenome]|uniref:Uncharacterized protein n=1 Tax=marine metagenome TaxID=408172 RepID=A0A382HVB9_9ZZZZ